MENFNLANDSITDEDDMRLFEYPVFGRQIIPIKHNDPKVTRFELFSGYPMNGRRWRRLGYLLGRNTHVEVLGIQSRNLDVAGLCCGLQSNQSVKKFWLSGVNLQHATRMSILAPFLRLNPSLKSISLDCCSLWHGSLGILSSALLDRKHDSLEELSLNSCRFGGVDLEDLVKAISGNRSLTKLWLRNNDIGPRGCASLAKLLENQEHALSSLYLDDNAINNNSAILLATSLAKNNKLKTLSLRGNFITSAGWSAMLKLVCNHSSINDVFESNHTLCDLGMQILAHDREIVDHALGVDNANLLRESLEINRSSNKFLVARQKILWNLAKGNLEVRDFSIAMNAMPRILAWFGEGSVKENIDIAHYSEHLLPQINMDAIRLDAIYCIIQSRPDLYSQANDSKRCQYERVGVKLMQEIHDNIEFVVYLVLFCMMVLAPTSELYQYKVTCHDISGSVITVLLLWELVSNSN